MAEAHRADNNLFEGISDYKINESTVLELPDVGLVAEYRLPQSKILQKSC